MKKIKAIDVSKHQGIIQWDKVKDVIEDVFNDSDIEIVVYFL